MIYVITSSKTEVTESINLDPDAPLHIRVPSRDLEDQPILGFTSIELGEKFLNLKNLSKEEYSVSPIDDLNDEYKNRTIVIFENKKQLFEMEQDTERYDYESQIHENAL